MASLNQDKRIQELEVQLNEAKCTIGSLREELERVNNELKRMKDDLVEPLNEQKTNDHATTDNGKHHESQQNSASNLPPLVAPGNLSTINIMNTTTGQKNKDSNCCFTGNVAQAESLRHLSAEKECGSNPDLASIIMRSKEPELYRNGCTQRIRAFEHNVLTVKVPTEQIDGQLPDSKNESNVSENEKLERPHTIDSAKTVKIVTWQARNSSESEVVQPSSSCGDGYTVKFARRFSPRKPRTRCIYMKPTDCFPSHKLDSRCHHASDIEGSKSKSGAVPTTKSISEEPAHKLLRSHSTPTSSVSSEGAEDKRLSLNRISSNEISGLVPCNNKNVTKQIVMKQNHLNYQNEISLSLPYSTENIEHGSSTEDLTLSSTTETKDGMFLSGTKQNDKVKVLEIDDSKMTPGDQNIAENSDVSDMKNDFPVIHTNSIVETACESSEALPQVGKDKFLKYTFQRTRKRGSSSSKNESVLPEKITATRNSIDKQNVVPEPQEPASVTELPRNNRRLMQVARQVRELTLVAKTCLCTSYKRHYSHCLVSGVR